MENRKTSQVNQEQVNQEQVKSTEQVIDTLRTELREQRRQNDALKQQLQNTGQVERDSNQRLTDTVNTFLDLFDRQTTSTLQVVVNLADSNANLRAQLTSANEKIRLSTMSEPDTTPNA